MNQPQYQPPQHQQAPRPRGRPRKQPVQHVAPRAPSRRAQQRPAPARAPRQRSHAPAANPVPLLHEIGTPSIVEIMELAQGLQSLGAIDFRIGSFSCTFREARTYGLSAAMPQSIQDQVAKAHSIATQGVS